MYGKLDNKKHQGWWMLWMQYCLLPLKVLIILELPDGLCYRYLRLWSKNIQASVERNLTSLIASANWFTLFNVSHWKFFVNPAYLLSYSMTNLLVVDWLISPSLGVIISGECQNRILAWKDERPTRTFQLAFVVERAFFKYLGARRHLSSFFRKTLGRSCTEWVVLSMSWAEVNNDSSIFYYGWS